MLQNIKVDVVYYKTNTDFEMEFNLCGCCRMRLLTDKAADSKTLIHSMARAVSRSRVIIVVGGLFGDDSIINLAAGALKMKLAAVDNKTYGIEGGEQIEILSGSTPLVTPEGYFGGCIIESGPQTMVLITDSKNIRKSIMQNLIHPYIEELAAAQLMHEDTAVKEPVTATAEAAPEVPSEIIEEVGVLQSEDEIITAEEILDTPEIEIIEDAAPEPEADGDEEIIIDTDSAETETNSEKIIFELETEYEAPIEPEDIISFTPEFSSRLNDADEIDDDYDFDYDSDSEFRKHESKKKASLNTPILIFSILLLLTVAVLSYCIFYIPAREGIAAGTYVREIFETLFG